MILCVVLPVPLMKAKQNGHDWIHLAHGVQLTMQVVLTANFPTLQHIEMVTVLLSVLKLDVLSQTVVS